MIINEKRIVSKAIEYMCEVCGKTSYDLMAIEQCELQHINQQTCGHKTTSIKVRINWEDSSGNNLTAVSSFVLVCDRCGIILKEFPYAAVKALMENSLVK
jgi:hypothetical protein